MGEMWYDYRVILPRKVVFMQQNRAALKAAFPHTIPILAGFGFLGMSFGVLMSTDGHPVWLSMLMSLAIYAGSMQFVTINLLTMAFHPIQAFFMAIMVNARHLFYGISMLEKYRDMGPKKQYLIFGLTDETFSINYVAKVPEGVDRGKFYFFTSLLNHLYWFCGTAVGAVLGSIIPFNTEGLDFVMTAMFVVILLEQLQKKENRPTALLGLAVSVIMLLIFGAEDFLIPAMLGILLVLTALRKPLEKAGAAS